MSVFSIFILGSIMSICESIFLVKGWLKIKYRRVVLVTNMILLVVCYSIFIIGVIPLVQLGIGFTTHKAIHVTDLRSTHVFGLVKLGDQDNVEYIGSNKISKIAYRKSAVYSIEYVPLFEYITKVSDSRGNVIYSVMTDYLHGVLLSLAYMVRVGLWLLGRKREGLL